ncbi:hypothetical protein [Bacillus sp. T3]|nr:hypothetical protein [Bacillus sp. T3]
MKKKSLAFLIALVFSVMFVAAGCSSDKTSGEKKNQKEKAQVIKSC